MNPSRLCRIAFSSLFLALLGCSGQAERPQFVAVDMSPPECIMKIQPLFSFDIGKDGTCRVTYVDGSGRVLCRVDGTGLPKEVVEFYVKEVAERQCPGDATVCVSQSGQIRLTQEELRNIVAVIHAAPPNDGVLGKLHPTVLSVLKMPPHR